MAEEEVKKERMLYTITLNKENRESIGLLKKIIDAKKGTANEKDPVQLDELLIGKVDVNDKELIDQIKKLSTTLSYRDTILAEMALNTGSQFETFDENFYEFLNKVKLVKEVKIINPKEIDATLNGTLEVISDETKDELKEKQDEELLPFASEIKDPEDKEKIEELTEDVGSPKEKEKIIKKNYEEKYYLTGERMLETLQATDVYKNLPTDIQKKIDMAYLKCADPTDLLDPKFLDKKMGEAFKMPDGRMAGFEDIHMMALGNTYVGYQINEVGTKGVEPGKEEVPDTSLIDVPMFIEDMPDSLKQQTKEKGYQFLAERIKSVINNNGPLMALAILRPYDSFASGAMEDFAETLGDTKEAVAMKLYIKEISSEFSSQVRDEFHRYKGRIKADLKGIDINDAIIRGAIVDNIKREIMEQNPTPNKGMETLEETIGEISAEVEMEALSEGEPSKESMIMGLSMEGQVPFDEMSQQLDEEIELSNDEKGHENLGE